jgi:hypothetical protein
VEGGLPHGGVWLGLAYAKGKEGSMSLEEQRQVQFFQDVLESRGVIGRRPDGERYTAGRPGPEFWVDAPWRLEPPPRDQDVDQQEIPFTFIIRDLEGTLDTIGLYDLLDGEEPVWTAQGPGLVRDRLWVARTTLRRSEFKAAGRRLKLKATFTGEWYVLGVRKSTWEQCVSIYLAPDPLPLRDTTQWYYGDTHYHSDYTNDIKEFGGPVADTRSAAECIGLDWLVLTDHSVDLDDENPYFAGRGGDSRWDALGEDVAQANSQGTVRILRGEEVTVLGKTGLPGGSNILHLLVFGSQLHKLIPGAWARKGLLSLIAETFPPETQELYEYLFGTIHELEAVLTGKDRDGQPVADLEGRSVQIQKALAFAAHPTTMAQGAGGTWEDEDLQQAIHGMEAWNGRAWFSADPEECPFGHWKNLSAKERGKCLKAVDRWDEILRWRLEHTAEPRFVLLAGSDAHGSFNYSVGLGKDWDGVRADDNCLGRVRTLLYLPEPKATREMLSEEEVVQAIRTGSCVVTDGPVLGFSLGFNGGPLATLGQVMPVAGDGTLDLQIRACSTEEFGRVEHVDVVYWFLGLEARETVRVRVGKPPGGPLGNLLANALRYVQAVPWEVGLPSRSGYVRLQTETEVNTPDGKQVYRCFTNPIWIQASDEGHRRLRVTYVDW